MEAWVRFLEAHVNKSSVSRMDVKIQFHHLKKFEHTNHNKDTQPHKRYPFAFAAIGTGVACVKVWKKKPVESLR